MKDQTQPAAQIVNNTALSLSDKAAAVKAAIFSYAYGPGPASAAAQAAEQMKKQTAAIDPAVLAGGGGALGGAALGALASRKNRLRNAIIGAALGSGGGLLASSLMGGKNAAANTAAGVKPVLTKKMQPDELDAMETMMELEEAAGKTAAVDFNKMIGDAGNYAKDLYNKVPAGVMQGAGMGGLGGGLAGGLAGLMAPGHDDVYDDEGNVIGRKQRSRFGSALRGLLGGGLMGASAGGLAGHFAPEATGKAYNAATGFGRDAYNAAAGFGGDLARRMGFRGKSDTPVTPTTAAATGQQMMLPGDKPTVKNPLYKGPNTASMTAPSMGFDASGIDMSNMQLPGSPTLGR